MRSQQGSSNYYLADFSDTVTSICFVESSITDVFPSHSTRDQKFIHPQLRDVFLFPLRPSFRSLVLRILVFEELGRLTLARSLALEEGFSSLEDHWHQPL